MNWIDYREKLGIGFEDSSKFQMCKNRIENMLSGKERYYNENDLIRYVNTIGEIMNCNSQPIAFVIHSLNKSSSFVEYISKYVAFMNSAERFFLVDREKHYASKLKFIAMKMEHLFFHRECQSLIRHLCQIICFG